MKVNYIENEIRYSRTIEGMGEGLVLFKVGVIHKRVGQNLHLFFEDKRKPPLDIAINPDSRTVEYCSFFAQDEKIVERFVINEIQYNERLLTIEEDFGAEMSINFEKEFEIIKSNSDIFVLCANLSNDSLQAYKIDNSNYLLYSDTNDFCGILLKNLSEKEWKEIQYSQCL